MTTDLATRVAGALRLGCYECDAPGVLADLWAEYRATVAALNAARADLVREQTMRRAEADPFDCDVGCGCGERHCPPGEDGCSFHLLSERMEAAEARATQAEADARRLRDAARALIASGCWAADAAEGDADAPGCSVCAGMVAALAGKEWP